MTERLTVEREKEIRYDDSRYVSVRALGLDRRELLAELDAVRKERDCD